MKSILRKMVAVFCLMIAMVATVEAQNSFAYQAVIRSANGDLVSEKQVSLRFSLKYNDEVVYSETHKTTTNKYGSVQVKVGEGQKVSGDFAKVPWHTMQVMMQIEVDPAGGDSYNVNLGAIQLQPAPYAIHAASTGLVFDSSSPKSGSGALFEVKDKNGNPVFAVFPDGVRVYVDDADGKPIQTGFAVAGRRAAKDGEEANLFSVTNEGTRVTVDDSEDKPMATGFAVAGRRAAKDGESDLFTVSSAGTQIYLDTDANGKPMQTGFAVAGRRAAKDGENDKYLEINSDGTHVYIDDEGKPIQTGFAVAGRRAAKGSNDKYLEVTADGTKVFVDANGKPIQTGFAVAGRRAAKGKKLKLFEVNSYGTHIYIDEDADGDKPIQTGFAVAGRRAAKDGDHEKYVVIDADGTIIYVDYEEAKAMQTGFAVAGRRAAKDGTPNSILTVNNQDGTRVYIDDSDSNRNDGKAMQTGFAVAGRRAAKDGEYIMQVTDNKASMLTQSFSIDDKQSNKSMMEMNTGGTAIKTENFVVAKEEENAAGETEEVNVFQATPDQGVQIASESKVVVKGDLAKPIEVEAIVATDNIELPKPIFVQGIVDTLCKDYAKILGEVSGYKFVKIRGNGLFTENQTFDNDGNAVIMFDIFGNVTQESRTAAVVVILTNPDSYDDAKLIFWPCRKISNALSINFGLMAAADSKGKYLRVEALVNSDAAVTNIELLSNNDKMGTVVLDGTPAYGSIVSAVAKPNPGFEFISWGRYVEGEWRGYYSNPLNLAIGWDSISLTAYFELGFYNVEFTADPYEGGELAVVTKKQGLSYEEFIDEPNHQNMANNGGRTDAEINQTFTLKGNSLNAEQFNEYGIYNTYGAEFTITAKPAEGFKFKNWNNNPQLTNPVIDVFTVTGDTLLKAIFEPIEGTQPYGGKAATLPGVIEAENFDVGLGAYNEIYNSDFSGCNYREDKATFGMENIKGTDGYALNYAYTGEWTDYTVQVEKAQKMRWAIRYSNQGQYGSARINITRNYENVTGTQDVKTTPSWHNYHIMSGETSDVLPAGEYKLRLNFVDATQSVNVDKIMFGKMDDVLLSLIAIQPSGQHPGGWGTAGTVYGYGFYPQGTEVPIKAVPYVDEYENEKYVFAGWYDASGNLLSTKADSTVTVRGDVQLYAKFVEEGDDIDEDEQAMIQIVTNLPISDAGQLPFSVSGADENVEQRDEYTNGGVTYYSYIYYCNFYSQVVLHATGSEPFEGWYNDDNDLLSQGRDTHTFTADNDEYLFYAKYDIGQSGADGGKATIRIMTNTQIALYLIEGEEETELNDWRRTDYYNDENEEYSYEYTYTCNIGDSIRFIASEREGLEFSGWWDETGQSNMPNPQDYVNNIDLYIEVAEEYVKEHCPGGYTGEFPNITGFYTEFTLKITESSYAFMATFDEEEQQPTGAKIQVKTNGEVQFTVNGETVTPEPTTDEDDNDVYTFTCNFNDEVTFYASGDHFAGWWLDCDEAEFFFSNHERGDDSYWEDLDIYCVGGYVVDQDAQEIEGFKTEFTKTITADLLNDDNVWALTAMFDDVLDTKVKYTVLDEDAATCALTHVGVDYFNVERTSFDIPQTVNIKGKPYTVTTIGEYAFCGCSGLKSVSIPASVTKIGKDAFLDCRSMTSARFASVEALCTMKFMSEFSNPMFPYDPPYNQNPCEVALYFGDEEKAVPSVEIPSDIDSVGQYAFINCRQLTSVSIPSNVKTIGNEAFARCVNLSSVTIAEGSGENGLQELKFKAFNQCGFTTIVLPNTLTTIGDNAFDNCDNLVSVVIPSSVTKMGKEVFSFIDNHVAVFCLTNGVNDEARFQSWETWHENYQTGGGDTYIVSVVYQNNQDDDEPNIICDDNGLIYFIYKFDAREEDFNIDEDVLRNLTSANNFTAANGEAIVIGYRGDRADALNLTIPNELGDGSKALRSEVVAIARYAFRGESIASLTIGGDGSKAASTSSNLRFIGQGAFCNAGLRNLTINGNDGTWYRYNYDEGGEAIQVATMDANEMTTCSCGYEYFCEFGKSQTIYVSPNGTGDGSKDNPVGSLADAENLMNDAETIYVVYISGKLTSPQVLSEKLITSNPPTYMDNFEDCHYAKSVIICGDPDSGVDNMIEIAGGWNGEDDPVTSVGSAFTNSASVPVKIKNLTISGGFSESGGGIYSRNSYGATDLTIAEGTIITTNKSTGTEGGGGVYSGGAFKMTGGEIKNNDAKYGGGIYIYNGTAEIAGGSITDNAASEDGGGIYVFEYSQEVILAGTETNPVNIKKNSANNGGGIFLSPAMQGSVIMGDDVNIEQNYAYYEGGGVYVSWCSSEDPTFEMNGGKIYNNSAGGDGGGIYIQAYSEYGAGIVKMTKGTISSNYSDMGDGAGVYVGADGEDYMSTFTMTGGTIEDNILSPEETHGSGVYNAGVFEMGGTAKVVFDDVYLSSNMASIVIISDFEGFEDGELAAYLSLSNDDFEGYQVVCGIDGNDELLIRNVVRFELNGSEYSLDTTDYNPGYVYLSGQGD